MAVDARRELIHRLIAHFTDSGELLVYLYGSFARRSATPQSNIDILLVSPDDTAHETTVDYAHDLSQEILAWTGNEAYVFNATRSWLRDSIAGGAPLVLSIRQDAIALIGPEFKQR